MIELTDELAAVKREIESLSKQIYVDRYLQIPEIAVVPLQLLSLYMHRAGFAADVRAAILTTTGLIQRGLDMHDRVTNRKELVRDRVTERQMLILAGDYYSSICYHLMAKAGLTCEVRKLASGITKNTAAKMELYDFNSENNFKVYTDIVNLLKEREASLYTEFLTGDLNGREQEAWTRILENLIVYTLNQDLLASSTLADDSLAFYLVRSLATLEELTVLYALGDFVSYDQRLAELAAKYQVADIVREVNQGLLAEAKEAIAIIDNMEAQQGLVRLVAELEHTYN